VDELMILAVVFTACGLVAWFVVRRQERLDREEFARQEAAEAEREKKRAAQRAARVVPIGPSIDAMLGIRSSVPSARQAAARTKDDAARRRREDDDDNVSEMRDRHNAMMASQASSWPHSSPSHSSSCSSRPSHSHDSGSSHSHSSSSCDSSSSSDSGSCSSSCD
jgi:hypothetical protein